MEAWLGDRWAGCGGRWVFGLVLSLACAFLSGPASAQDAAPRLVVLHRDAGDLPLAQREEVDRLLLRSVVAQLRFASAHASEVPLDDIELAAGCTTRDLDCTQRIADSLGADWLLVRELTRDRQGRVFLTLIAHDGPGAVVTRRVVSQLGGGQGKSSANVPSEVVPGLVARLYPKAPALLDERTPSRARTPAGIVGWSLAGASVSLLIAGTTMGVLSHQDHAAYQNATIRSQRDVDHAEGLLARSQQRARVANGLLIGGASAGLASAATLLWTYLRPSAEVHDHVRLAVTPARSGLSLSMAGDWRGGL